MLEAVCAALSAAVVGLSLVSLCLLRRVNRIETAFQTAAERLQEADYAGW